VLLEPRVVRGALDREVEREVDAVLAAGRHERVEVRLGPSSGWIVVWPPSGEPIAHGEPGSPVPAATALLRPLRFLTPMGWMGGR
jgi:hypothetical protein